VPTAHSAKSANPFGCTPPCLDLLGPASARPIRLCAAARRLTIRTSGGRARYSGHHKVVVGRRIRFGVSSRRFRCTKPPACRAPSKAEFALVFNHENHEERGTTMKIKMLFCGAAVLLYNRLFFFRGPQRRLLGRRAAADGSACQRARCPIAWTRRDSSAGVTRGYRTIKICVDRPSDPRLRRRCLVYQNGEHQV